MMIGNWLVAVLFYIPPVYFPHTIWLGLEPMLSSVGSALATTAINAALKPPGTISQLSKNYDQVKTLTTGFANAVYSIRQRV